MMRSLLALVLIVLSDEVFPNKSLPFSRKSTKKKSMPSAPWNRISTHLISSYPTLNHIRLYSSSKTPPPTSPDPKLTHVSSTGSAHMVSISSKSVTSRLATAVCSIHFSNPSPLPLIKSNSMKKGDALSVARIAGIMAAKRTSDLVPLCHPIAISSVVVDLVLVDGNLESQLQEAEQMDRKKKEKTSIPWQGTGQGDTYPFHKPASAPTSKTPPDHGRIDITATVECDGKTGVEMEALTAASVAALTVYDMCKAVDKGMWIEGLRVVRKEGGKSGTWIEGETVVDRGVGEGRSSQDTGSKIRTY
jgi:molybdenum cofactor biosynthesis protein MoaC